MAGVLRRRSAAPSEAPALEIVFWEYLGPDRVQASTAEASTATIRDLLERPAEFAERAVRVVGKFRGDNLEHDRPEAGPRSAWVIKSGHHAIWVTGHKPAGRGFALKSDSAQDTDKWLEVVGRLETWKGVTLLRAKAVALTAPAASILRGPRLRTLEKPEVVFTLPLVGDEPVAPDTVFLVQFSTYMDEDTFENRVRLRYADQPEPESELRGIRWRYDEVKRTLVVDPGAPLRRGAGVEMLLLPGIADAWAVPLLPAPEGGPQGILRLLRWQVQGGRRGLHRGVRQRHRRVGDSRVGSCLESCSVSPAWCAWSLSAHPRRPFARAPGAAGLRHRGHGRHRAGLRHRQVRPGRPRPDRRRLRDRGPGEEGPARGLPGGGCGQPGARRRGGDPSRRRPPEGSSCSSSI